MQRKTLRFRAAAWLLAGLLLAVAPAALAQARAVDSSAGTLGTPAGSTTSPNLLAERDMAGVMLSDVRAETEFSKLALKNSGDDGVKQIARRTISENNKLDAQLTTLIASDSAVNNDVFNYGQITSQARQTEKQMKKLKGAEFDTLYLSELKAYALRNQGAIRADSPASESSQMRQVSQRIQNQSDKQMQELQQVAQSENVKLD